MSGQLTIMCDTEDFRLDVDVITGANMTMNKKVMTTPIVSQGVDSTFPLESGSGMNYTFTFSRRNPPIPNDESTDTTLWSNEKWYSSLTTLMDRWQARTNGFIFSFNEDGSNPHRFIMNRERGYIRTLERVYEANNNSLITGDIVITIGTMYMNAESTRLDSAYIPAVQYTYVELDPGELLTLPSFGTTLSALFNMGNRTLPILRVPLPMDALEGKDMAFKLPGIPPLWEMFRKMTVYTDTGSSSGSPRSFEGWSTSAEGTDPKPTGDLCTITESHLVVAPLRLYAVWGVGGF